jgi:hypothetical protein
MPEIIKLNISISNIYPVKDKRPPMPLNGYLLSAKSLPDIDEDK